MDNSVTDPSTPWETGGRPDLALAMLAVATENLGPGKRFVVWVQGCLLNCIGCVSPAWRDLRCEKLVTPEALAGKLLSLPGVDGITLSGGEPMLQAGGLTDLIRLVRSKRSISVVCFTGYTIENLLALGNTRGVGDLLAETDVLIDGPYIATANDNRGLRGSTNQRIHFLTGRLSKADYDYTCRGRTAEISVYDGALMMIGVPAAGALESFRRTADRAGQMSEKPGLRRPRDAD